MSVMSNHKAVGVLRFFSWAQALSVGIDGLGDVLPMDSGLGSEGVYAGRMIVDGMMCIIVAHRNSAGSPCVNIFSQEGEVDLVWEFAEDIEARCTASMFVRQQLTWTMLSRLGGKPFFKFDRKAQQSRGVSNEQAR